MHDRTPLGPRTVLTAVGVTLAVLFVLTLGYLAWRVITWMIIALFFALALDHAVRLLERRGLRRGTAIAAVSALVLVAFSGLGFLFIPPAVAQVTEFVQALPDIVERLSRGRGPLGFLEREFEIVERLRDAVEDGGDLPGAARAVAGPLLTVVQSAAVAAIALVSIVFLTLFFLVYGPGWARGLLELAPDRVRPYWERGLYGIRDAIGGWVVGAVAIALVAGTTATLVLVAMGVPYALPLGLFVAVLDPIPFLGATLAAVVVSAVVFASEGVTLALVFLAFFLGYQQLENNLVYPLVYGKTVRLSPLAVLVAVLVGGELAGIVGALAAIPVSAAIKVAAGEAMRYRRERITSIPPPSAPGR